MIEGSRVEESNLYPNKKLFIGLLPASITTQQLLDYFSRHGSVAEVWIAKNSKGFCKGHGYVIMTRSEDALRILEHPHSHYEIGGRPIFVKPYLEGSQLKLQRANIVKRRIYISNIPFTVTDLKLKMIFQVFGPVENAYRITTLNGEKRRFGYVSFKSQKSASSCLSKGKIEIEGSTVYCSVFVPKEKQDQPI